MKEEHTLIIFINKFNILYSEIGPKRGCRLEYKIKIVAQETFKHRFSLLPFLFSCFISVSFLAFSVLLYKFSLLSTHLYNV